MKINFLNSCVLLLGEENQRSGPAGMLADLLVVMVNLQSLALKCLCQSQGYSFSFLFSRKGKQFRLMRSPRANFKVTLGGLGVLDGQRNKDFDILDRKTPFSSMEDCFVGSFEYLSTLFLCTNIRIFLWHISIPCVVAYLSGMWSAIALIYKASPVP